MSENLCAAIRREVARLLSMRADGVREGNVDGVEVVRVRRALLRIEASTADELLGSGALVRCARDWVFALAWVG